VQRILRCARLKGYGFLVDIKKSKGDKEVLRAYFFPRSGRRNEICVDKDSRRRSGARFGEKFDSLSFMDGPPSSLADSPTDESSGLLLPFLMDGPTDESSGLLLPLRIVLQMNLPDS